MLLHSGERVDDLQRAGLRIIQSPDSFCFSIDAVLLAHFATVKHGDYVIDLGTGSGVIPLLVSSRAKRLKVTGLELNPEVADRARRSVELNKLSESISIVEGDLKQSAELLGRVRFDLVLCNPPYLPLGIGETSHLNVRRMARHEVTATLYDVIKAAAELTSTGGRFALVHRPFRLGDIMCTLREFKLEPKRLRMVHPTQEKEANIVLIESIKDAKPDLKVGAPIYVHEPGGGYSAQVAALYAGGELAW